MAIATGLAGAIALLAGVTVAMVEYNRANPSGYSLANHFISELGWGRRNPGAWAFNLGIGLAGWLCLPLLWELGAAVGTRLAKAGAWVGIGTALLGSLIGVWPMDQLQSHLRAAVGYFFGVPIAVGLFTFALGATDRSKVARALVRAGQVLLIVWMLFLLWPKASVLRALRHLDTFVRPDFWPVAALEWATLGVLAIWWGWAIAYLWSASRRS